MDGLKGGYKLTLKDEKGGQAEFYCYQNIILPSAFPELFDPEEKFESIKRFQYREEDILISSFPKSGNHWLTNLLMLVVSKDPVETATSVNVNLIDIARPTARLNAKRSPRIITSHLKYDRLPEEHFQNSGKVILLVRNPKDVAVSYYYHVRKDRNLQVTLSWDSYLKNFCEGKMPFGSYFDYLNDWQTVLQRSKNLNVLLVYYEDLKQQTLSELQRIQRYLGVYNDEDRLKSIIAKCSFSSLKSDVDSGKIRTMLKDINDKPFLYRKGDIGDWMNHFTVSQNKEFEKIIKDRLRDSIFQFQFTSSVPKHRL